MHELKSYKYIQEKRELYNLGDIINFPNTLMFLENFIEDDIKEVLINFINEICNYEKETNLLTLHNDKDNQVYVEDFLNNINFKRKYKK